MVKGIFRLFGRTRFRGYTLLGQKHKPMLRLLDEMRGRGVCIEELDALEIFGRDGLDHTTTYADRVRNLEIWEIDERLRPDLERNFPGAVVRIVDSYEEVGRSGKRFDLIVIDNVVGVYGDHCDHFDFFPDKIFRIMGDRCILVLIVIPRIGPETLRHFPNLNAPDYLSRRTSFYGVSDPTNIPVNRMTDVYRGFAERNGYRLDWAFNMKRGGAGVDYLAMSVFR